MNSLEIFINGELIDYFDKDDFPLRLFRRAIDFKDPSSRKGENTYTIKIPNTLNNQKIFGSLQQLDELYKFRRGAKYQCTVNNNSETVIKGIFYLTKVNKDEIEGYISAHVGEIGGLLKGKSLRDLGSMEYDFDCWESMRLNLYKQILDFDNHYKNLVCYPLVSYGKYFIPNIWSEGNVIPGSYYPEAAYGTKNVAPREIFGVDTYGLNNNSNTYLYYADVPPTHYLRPILEQIFTDIGYKISGSWIETDEVKQLVMPYVGDRNPIYNWTRIGEVISNASGRQRVGGWLFIHENTGDANHYFIYWIYTSPLYANRRCYFDINNKLNKVLYNNYCNDSVGGLTEFDNYVTLFNVLRFEYVTQDKTFSMNTTTVLDITGEPAYSIYTCPVDGLYTFHVKMQVLDIDNNMGVWNDGSIGLPPVNQDIRKQAWGISVIEGVIPNNLDNSRTFDPLNPTNDCCRYTQAITTDFQVIDEYVPLELKANDKVVLWISIVSLCEGSQKYIVDNRAFFAGELVNWLKSHFPPPPPGDELSGDYMLHNTFEVKDVELTVTIDNLPDTQEKDKFGYFMRVQQNLPDIQQLDLLKSIINLYNLYLEVDVENKVCYLEQINNFYQPNVTAYDITEKTSHETFDVMPPDVPEQYNFKWLKDDSDYVTTLASSSYDVELKTLVTGAVDSVDIDSGVFASTEFELFSVVATDVFSQPFDNPNYRALYQVSIPRMVGKDNYFDVPNAAGSGGYNYKPRLLKCVKAMIFDDMPITQRDTYNNLRSFADLPAIIQLDFANTLSWKTLYPLYYRDFYDSITKGFEVSCLVNLNSYDYTQMRINRPINYNGVIFYLKNINGFNPVNNSLTKLNLFR